MPNFQIRLVNQDFTASEERELPSANAARREAIRGAVAMAADELCDGAKLFGCEVSIGEDGSPPQRFVVTVAASPLKNGS